MDMSFARRRKGSVRTEVPDLPSLLSEAGARQAASRTARIQARIASSTTVSNALPLVDIFAPEGHRPPAAARFSTLSEPPVTGRQSK